ncbi:hypothetical protein ACLOJK_023569 [Asimina triloba]
MNENSNARVGMLKAVELHRLYEKHRGGNLLTFTQSLGLPALIRTSRWKMEDGCATRDDKRWKMEDGCATRDDKRWKMEDGCATRDDRRWKMEDGRWKMDAPQETIEDGRWKMDAPLLTMEEGREVRWWKMDASLPLSMMAIVVVINDGREEADG